MAIHPSYIIVKLKRRYSYPNSSLCTTTKNKQSLSFGMYRCISSIKMRIFEINREDNLHSLLKIFKQA